jgi:hypothetical protein
MWNKIRGNPLFFIGSLILLIYGGFNFIKLAVVPHITNVTSRF